MARIHPSLKNCSPYDPSSIEPVFFHTLVFPSTLGMSCNGLGGVGRCPFCEWGSSALWMRAREEQLTHFLTILGRVQRALLLALAQKTRAEAGIQVAMDKMLERWAGPHKTLQTTSKQQLASLTAPAEMNGIPGLTSIPPLLLPLQLQPGCTKWFSLLHLLFDADPAVRVCRSGKRGYSLEPHFPVRKRSRGWAGAKDSSVTTASFAVRSHSAVHREPLPTQWGKCPSSTAHTHSTALQEERRWLYEM